MRYLFTITVISLFLISGCSSNMSVIENEQVKQENAKLKEKNKQLEMTQTSEQNSELTQQYVDELNQKLKMVQAESKEHKETITRYQKAFELLTTETTALVDTLSIFSPEKIKTGDRIAGLTVSKVGEETNDRSTSYFVNFTGEFKVKGLIFHSLMWGNGYSFVVKENLESMPHMLFEFDKGAIYFDINNDEELIKQLGDKLENLSEFDSIEIEAVFKNYWLNYVPGTDYPSTAEFVRLTSEK